MTMVLFLFGGAAALELLVHLFGGAKHARQVLAVVALIAGGLTAGALLATNCNVFSGLLVFLGLYRLLNMIRVVKARMHEEYLRRATRRTSLMIMLLQLVVLLAWGAWNEWHTTGYASWAAAGIMQAVGAGLLLASTVRTLRRTKWPHSREHFSDHDLPTVTVAIPARNETDDLQQCLQSVLASDYPKLEVIVLDDCSQTKRTPAIIKAFAHDGVRFIKGEAPAKTWLPKNQAYNHLASEATGEYILFCGVDIRCTPSSIRNAITIMLVRNKQMLSILPRRQRSAYGRFSLIQAMRYWWELVPPRRLFRRPPVLSSCWIIQARALRRAGGFASVARSIVPEAHFARELIGIDGYSFLRSSDALGIESNKQVQDQRNTAIRMRYPQMHKRPEQSAFTALLESFFMLLPFAIAIGGFWLPIGDIGQLSAAVACVLLTITYELVVLATRVNAWWFGLIGLPLAVLADLGLLHYSMWRYEFSIVEWKGRNVCIPVMHVVPHLPKV